MSNNHAHFAERERLTTLAASASIVMAILMATLKSWAAWQTGSVAMLGSLADSTLDILASGVTLYAVRLSAAPADIKHGFGHGKAEALAALPAVTAHVDRAAIDRLTDPANYLGLAPQMVDRAIAASAAVPC